jgi:chromosome segregation ATPase
MNEFFEQINKSLLADSQKIEQINKSLLADSKKIEQIKKSLFSDSKNVPEAKKTLDEMVASLERNGKKINQIIENNEESLRAAYGKIQQKHQEIENLIQKLNDKEEELNKKIKNADETMVLATTVGLAGAFDQRAKELKMSMRYWVGLLILALGIGGWLGYQKMQDFLQLIKDSKATSEFIWIYMILALASFGG